LLPKYTACKKDFKGIFFLMYVRVCKCRSLKVHKLKTSYNNHILFIVQSPFFFLPKHNVSNNCCFPFFRWLVEIMNSVPFGYLAQLVSENIPERTNCTNFWNFMPWMTETMDSTEIELYNKVAEGKTCANDDNMSKKTDFSIWGENVLLRRKYRGKCTIEKKVPRKMYCWEESTEENVPLRRKYWGKCTDEKKVLRKMYGREEKLRETSDRRLEGKELFGWPRCGWDHDFKPYFKQEFWERCKLDFLKFKLRKNGKVV
jgi:hypothetical protein